MSKEESPIFIVGMIRSGTTLLRSILNSHPNISIPRETSFFFLLDEYKRKNKIDNYSKKEVGDFWRWYSQKRRFTYLGLRKEDVEQNLQIFKDSKDFKNILDSVMYTNQVENKKSRWGEKTPGHEMYLDKIFEFYPNARVIFMVRDPRAIYASQKNVPWGNQFISVIIKRWNTSVNFFKKYKNDKRVKLITYEDLVTRTKEVIEDLCFFIDEIFDENMLKNRKINLSAGNEKSWTNKYEKEVTRKIDSSSINKWKDNNSKWEIAVLEKYSDQEIFSKFYENSDQPFNNYIKLKYFYLKSRHYLKYFIDFFSNRN